MMVCSDLGLLPDQADAMGEDRALEAEAARSRVSGSDRPLPSSSCSRCRPDLQRKKCLVNLFQKLNNGHIATISAISDKISAQS